jgi:hypothetical protein
VFPPLLRLHVSQPTHAIVLEIFRSNVNPACYPICGVFTPYSKITKLPADYADLVFRNVSFITADEFPTKPAMSVCNVLARVTGEPSFDAKRGTMWVSITLSDRHQTQVRL